MASNILAGFVGGAAKYGLDQINHAQQEEREMRKLKFLEDLRKDTEKEMAEFRDHLERGRIDKSMSTDNYTTGKRTLRNQYGEDVGSIDLPGSAMQDYKDEQAKSALDRQYKEGQIANFGADNARADEALSIQRANLGLSKQRLSLDEQTAAAAAKGGVAGDKSDSMSVGQEIVYRNSKVADDLIKAGVPAEVVQKTAALSAARAKARGGGFADAQLIFLDAASRLRGSADPTAVQDFSQRFLNK